MLARIPRWAQIAGGVAILLLLPLVIVLPTANWGSDPIVSSAPAGSVLGSAGAETLEPAALLSRDRPADGSGTDAAHGPTNSAASTVTPPPAKIPPELDGLVEAVRAKILEGKVTVATAEFMRGSLARVLPAEVVGRLLDAVGTVHSDLARITPEGLVLYGELLKRLARNRIPYLEFEFHLRRLRHQALTLGGLELLKKVGDPILGYDGLPAYFEGCGYGLGSFLEIAGYHILHERWREALPLLDAIFAGNAIQKCDLDLFLRAGELVARATGSGASPSAVQPVVARFLALADSRFGSGSRRAEEVHHWFTGLARLYHPHRDLSAAGPLVPEREFDWGASSIAKALARNELAEGQRTYRFDHARALAAEATCRENNLSNELSRGERPDRVRQLFRAAWSALMLRDARELAAGMSLLGESFGSERPRGLAYLALLEGAEEISAGLAERGRKRIASVLAENPGLFQEDEARTWRAIEAGAALPRATDRGRTYFDLGKNWWDLEQFDGHDRVKAHLKAELTASADLAYLTFLEAQSDLRVDRTASARERLQKLLDGELPADLTRGEVAGLVWHAEVRDEELERIRARRAQALEHFAGCDSHEDAPLQILAKICAWQIRMQAEHGAYVLKEAGSRELEEIERALDAPWLDLRLQEKLLELQENLLALARDHRDAGDFDKALETLKRCRKLVKNLPRYRKEEAAILARQAATLPAAEEAKIRATWLAAGDAYQDSASLNFGDSELFLDATESYLNAGDVGLAKVASALYVPSHSKGAASEANFWRILLFKVRIERELGNLSEALRLIGETFDREEAGMHRYELLLEQAACLTLQGKDDAALANYDRVYAELQPSSAIWREGLYRKARLLNARVQREVAAKDQALKVGPEDAASRSAREAWEEVAAWLPADGSDARLAEALYFAGEARIDTSDESQARRHFERLVAAAEAARNLSMPQSARDRWELYREKALFLVADTFFHENDYENAIAHYKEVVRQFTSSARVPYGYYQLGECALRLGRKSDAVEYFQRGERKVTELSPQAMEELPPRRGKQFWQDAFHEKIAILGG